MTTIPERLKHPWFYGNIKYLLSLGDHYSILISIPYHLKRKNEKYVIPQKLYDLSKNSNNRLILYRIKNDYGPLTKLYGPLLNDDISDNSALLICDDDIHYLPKFVDTIYDEYIKDTSKMYNYCNNSIQGYKGYMVQKRLIKPILKMKRPKTCFRIDDTFIQLCVKKLELTTECVKYDNNDDSDLYCNMDKDILDKTPDWDKLSYDNRDEMYGKCEIDFKK